MAAFAPYATSCMLSFAEEDRGRRRASRRQNRGRPRWGCGRGRVRCRRWSPTPAVSDQVLEGDRHGRAAGPRSRPAASSASAVARPARSARSAGDGDEGRAASGSRRAMRSRAGNGWRRPARAAARGTPRPSSVIESCARSSSVKRHRAGTLSSPARWHRASRRIGHRRRHWRRSSAAVIGRRCSGIRLRARAAGVSTHDVQFSWSRSARASSASRKAMNVALAGLGLLGEPAQRGLEAVVVEAARPSLADRESKTARALGLSERWPSWHSPQCCARMSCAAMARGGEAGRVPAAPRASGERRRPRSSGTVAAGGASGARRRQAVGAGTGARRDSSPAQDSSKHREQERPHAATVAPARGDEQRSSSRPVHARTGASGTRPRSSGRGGLHVSWGRRERSRRLRHRRRRSRRVSAAVSGTPAIVMIARVGAAEHGDRGQRCELVPARPADETSESAR